MRRIIFITSASGQSGMGHLMRTLRLASAISTQCATEVILLGESGAGVQDTNVQDSNVKLHHSTWAQCKDSLRILSVNSQDILCFDVPDEQYNQLQAFANWAGRVVSINMYEKHNQVCYEDIAIYPLFAPNQQSLIAHQLLSHKTTIQVSGADYIMVDPAFFSPLAKPCDSLSAIPLAMPSAPARSSGAYALVTMGGADPMDYTFHVLKAVMAFANSTLIYKIILPQQSDLNAMQDMTEHCDWIELYEFGQVDFVDSLKSAEFAIINGGMTRYECVASNTYFIALSLHRTQYALTQHVTKHGYGINLGVFDQTNISTLTPCLAEYLIANANANANANDISTKRHAIKSPQSIALSPHAAQHILAVIQEGVST